MPHRGGRQTVSQAPKRQIFRQAALDRLSSPEQLDRLAIVTDSIGWLALSTIAVLIAAAVTWGIVGKIPDQVEGKGILVSAGGRILDAMSPSDGIVSKLFVDQNTLVEKGQEVAVIEQAALRQERQSAIETLSERQKEKAQIISDFEREFDLKRKNFAEQAAAQNQIIKAAEQRAGYLKKTMAARMPLADKGLLPRDKVEEIRTDYNKALQDISAANNKILELESDTLTLKSDHAKEITKIDQRIADAEREIRELDAKLSLNGVVLAPASGRVTELKVFEGGFVQTGAPVISIVTAGSNLQAVVYIPTKDGKRIQPGMTVRVAPSFVKKEEHGTIIGTVMKISEFPASKQGMLTVLQNEQLVNDYTSDGAPYEARVDLVRDAATISGFKWTSGAGPNAHVTTGTTIEAEVTVKEEPPVNLIIPFVRKHTGIGFWPSTSAR
ncbi:MAG: NHLP bacteriocin system secretion protein [Rhodospirillaceae bacterium]|nr:NHLP bacteriocin system secretion protein [Magnetovibrio sp.]MAY66500.1 NHLP bacteriocin system secretion protein [Rhodospirillaceae bacterium]